MLKSDDPGNVDTTMTREILTKENEVEDEFTPKLPSKIKSTRRLRCRTYLDEYKAHLKLPQMTCSNAGGA